MFLIVFKFILSSFIVIILSIIAENISTKWAGIISGLPTGTAITLYFYGLENGLEFASESAIYNMIGLIAMQMFLYGYYISSFTTKVGKYNIIISIVGAFFSYFIAVVILSKFYFNTFFAISIPLISFLLFRYLFRNIKNTTIKNKIKLTWKVILIRAILASSIILLITTTASMVGSEIAGLFSAFPTTVFPLLLIIHLTYGKEYTYSIIKHVPDGLVGLLIYSLTLHCVYPDFDLYIGIIIGFFTTFIYLFFYKVITEKVSKIKEV